MDSLILKDLVIGRMLDMILLIMLLFHSGSDKLKRRTYLKHTLHIDKFMMLSSHLLRRFVHRALMPLLIVSIHFGDGTDARC